MRECSWLGWDRYVLCLWLIPGDCKKKKKKKKKNRVKTIYIKNIKLHTEKRCMNTMLLRYI
eukprot:NODE_26491_length_549_cov_1.639810.p6 GENE.NODE_26491_length_549_cov_1.639810~~NODE_26491_length_549_cov_1.639810.p6  ORF type:complete len:61 (+),score=27.75 NODE_26491_length_549_cov_1.639810:331-513(+)